MLTIARTLSAGGEEIGRQLAEDFGMRYVDDEIIDRAAVLAGVTAAEMARAEMRKTLIARIFEGFAHTGVLDYEYATHYDLVINTDHLGIEDAAGVIRALVRQG